MRSIVFFLVAIFCMTGCSTQVEKVSAKKIEELRITDESKMFSVYYTEEKWGKSPLEPEGGCMTGAFVFEDRFIDGDWKKFEEVTKKSHDIYGYAMRAGEEFPLTWALECFVNGKTPLIALYPRNRNAPFEEESILKTAEDAGAFQIPLFLQCYPDATAYGDGEAYGAFYRKTRRIFQEKAPNAVFVWSVPADTEEKALNYYPGDAYVDWIGLDVFEKSGEQGQGVSEKVERWYDTWQKRKPLMISQLAVSHYSTRDSCYTEEEAAAEIERFYSSLSEYPRIKAVVYREGNPAADGVKKAVRENYLLTDNDRKLQAYTKAVSATWLSPKRVDDLGEEVFRSPFLAYESEGRIYLQESAVVFDLEEKMAAEGKIINGKKCIPVDCLKKYRVIKENQKILLQKI